MEQAADFYLRLHEEVNAPAKRARDAVRQLSGGLVASRSELARTESALARFYRKQAEEPARAAEQRRKASGVFAGGVAGRVLGGRGGEILGGVAGGELGGLGVAAAVATEGVGLLVEGVRSAIDIVGELGKRFVESTAEGLQFAQNMRLSFGFLTHDAELGRATFEDVRREAQGLALDVHDTTDSFRQLLAAQFSIGQAHDLVKMAADMQAVGSSAEEVQRILYAVREVKDIGALQQRQVRQLEMAGISGSLINKHLQLELGATSHDQVEKLRKQGKIAADVGVRAIEAAVREKLGENALGDVAAQMGQQTIAGMFRTAKGTIDNGFITLGERMEAPATRLAKRVFQTFEHVADSPAVARFADKTVEGFTRAVDWVDAHWDTIDSAVLKTADVLSNTFVGAIDFVRDHWDVITDTLRGGAYVLGALAVAALVVAAPFIAIGVVAVGAAAGIAYLTAKLVDSRREIGEWMKIAAIPLALTGIGVPAAIASYGAGALLQAGTPPGPGDIASDIVSESKQRQLSNLGPSGQLSPLSANIPEGAIKNIRIGDINLGGMHGLDLGDDAEGSGQKVASLVRREVMKVLDRG